MNKKRGLSLIELLVSITLLSILLLVFTQIFVIGTKVYQKESRRATLQSENRIVLDRIVSDVKQAYRVSSSSTASQVILELPAIDINENILYDTTGSFKTDTITYTLTGNTLSRQIVPDTNSSRTASTKSILGNISTLSFTYIPDVNDVKSVKINIKTTTSSAGENISVDNSSTVKLRNR